MYIQLRKWNLYPGIVKLCFDLFIHFPFHRPVIFRQHPGSQAYGDAAFPQIVNKKLLSLEYSSLKQFRQSLWLTDIFLST